MYTKKQSFNTVVLHHCEYIRSDKELRVQNDTKVNKSKGLKSRQHYTQYFFIDWYYSSQLGKICGILPVLGY